MQSTLGFAPLTQNAPSPWLSADGKRTFISLVVAAVEDELNETLPSETDKYTDVTKILTDIVGKRGDSDEIVSEAVVFAKTTLINRIKMHKRLESMRETPIRTQSRGSCDREKGCLPMAQVRNSANKYDEYIKQQQQFRQF